ncbi:MAG: YlxR family protein [Firmicutes bacterium]|nr:YlxR family protein [Bacillota bacterium]
MQPKRKIPQRRCVGCREMKDKIQVLRIVCNADGNISIDRTGKAHGRGAYVCRNTDCLNMAIKSKGLERSLKRAVPQEIYELLKIELER